MANESRGALGRRRVRMFWKNVRTKRTKRTKCRLLRFRRAPAVELEGQQGFLQQTYDGLPLAAVPGPFVLSKLSKT
jgi:hypothetical protein